MSLRRRLITLTGVAVVGSAIVAGAAESPSNPYHPILERNAFALKPIPEPAPPPPPETAPPPPPSSIKLTGITSILSTKRALFEITPQTPGKLPTKPILGVGDPAVDGLEVVAIDVDKGEVKIRNNGEESTVTFAAATSEPAPGTPGAPGQPRPGMPSPVTTGAVAPGGNDGGPTIVERNGGTGGRGNSIVVSGGNSGSTTPTSFGGNAAYGGNAAFNPNTAAMSGNNRTVPVRPIRTPTTPNVPPMTREQAIIQLELQRQINAGKNFPPLPPTPITPTEE